MTQFSSGKHEKLTADPNPWAGNGKRAKNRQSLPTWAQRPATYAPRPEFDRPLTNPANPILEDVRLQEPHMVDAQIRYWMGSVPTHVVATLPEGCWYTAAQLGHAREVLGRLAALS